MPKISPIYNLITDLKQENNNLAVPFLHIESGPRNYFLFKLAISTSAILGDDYVLEEAHFSIDEEYNYSQHGYTPIHYTQSYFSTDKKKYIVIHGFLDAQGKFLYSQAKELNDKKIFMETYVDFTSNEETILKTHIEKCTPVLEPLFTEKKAREKQLKQESVNLDWELTRLSQSLDFEKTRKEYIKKAHKFIDTIQRLNRYSETQDKRSLFLFNIIEQIEKIDACIKQKPISKKSEKESVQEVFEIKGEIQQSESIEDLYTQAITKFSEIIAEFQGCTPDLLCKPDLLKKKHELANALHEQLFIIYYFPEKLVSTKNKKTIEKSLNHVNKFYENEINLLTAEALKGNKEAVQELFPVCSRYITTDFYENLVNRLLEKKCIFIQEKILSICDYLNEHDYRYRDYIFDISQKKEFSILNETAEELEETKIPIKKNTEKQISHYKASLLFQLYLTNKKNIFEKFLIHGASADTWGSKKTEKNKTLPLALFYSISTVNTLAGNHIDYLRILLQYVTNPNAIFTKKENKKEKSHPAPVTLLNKETIFTPVQILTQAINLTPETLDFFNLLLEKSSISRLAFSLSSFYNHSLIHRETSIAKQFSLYYKENLNEEPKQANKKTETLSKLSFPYYIFSPKIDLEPRHIEEVHRIYNKMKFIEENIIKKISTLTLNKFQEEYNIAYKIAEEEFTNVLCLKSKRNITTVFDFFLGCELLLMSYACNSIKAEDQYTFISKHSKKLYGSIISIIKIIYPGKEGESKIQFYTEIKNSFSKKHTASDLPKPIVTHFENMPTLQDLVPDSSAETTLENQILKISI